MLLDGVTVTPEHGIWTVKAWRFGPDRSDIVQEWAGAGHDLGSSLDFCRYFNLNVLNEEALWNQ